MMLKVVGINYLNPFILIVLKSYYYYYICWNTIYGKQSKKNKKSAKKDMRIQEFSNKLSY